MEGLLKATRAATAKIKQNDPLAHRRRRRQRSGAGGMPMGGPLHGELKKSLGAMTDEDRKKADQLWKMLDDMYENDPAEYREFIEAQMRMGKEESMKFSEEAKAGANEQQGVPSSLGRSDQGTLTGSFTPKAGFVVKAATRFTSEKIFLNMCYDNAIKRPLAASGVELEEDAPPAMARQIPLVVGKPRVTKDMAGRECRAVDCVFNEWVILHCMRDNMFKVHVVELAMQWCEEDCGLKLQRNWKCPKSKYKGGTGPKGNNPVPFPVEIPPEKREKKSRVSGENLNGVSNETQDSREVANSSINDPSDLLRSMRSQSEETVTLGSPEVSNVGSTKKSLVVDVTDGDASQSGADGSQNSKKKERFEVKGKEVNNRNSIKSKKNKKKGAAVKKGFLQSSKHKALYPEGSNEGEPKGIYAKCNVVDTRTMSQEQIADAVKQHAAPKKKKVQKKVPPRAPAVPKKPSPVDDAEFDSLMKLLDPDALDDDKLNIAKAEDLFNKMAKNAGENQYTKEFASLARLLSGNHGNFEEFTDSKKENEEVPKKSSTKAEVDLNSESAAKTKSATLLKAEVTQDAKQSLHQGSAEPPAPATPAVSSANKRQKPEYIIESCVLKDGRSGFQVLIQLPAESGMKDVKLEVSKKALRLSTPRYLGIKVRFPDEVDDTSVQAKFSKKKKRLKVAVAKC